MLLIVTNKSDLACDYLVQRLYERRICFTRINTEDYGTKFSVRIAIGKAVDVAVMLSAGRELSATEISAVYFRQARTPGIRGNISESDQKFAQREHKEALRSLWRAIDTEKWLNHPRNLWLASNKIEQLLVARDFGLLIPETCLTSDRNTLITFFRSHDGKIICKAVKNGFYHSGNTVTLATTKRVDSNFIENFDRYANIPMIFQKEIRKKYDIRTTIIGNNIFSTAIYSQENAETEVDWRVSDTLRIDLKHEMIQLPREIESSCVKLASHFGLNYAAIDLVLGTDDKFYFLELNPNGQWAWIEKKVGYPIRDAIIDFLPIRST